LRVGRDPPGALVLLDSYAASFPHGHYAAEVSVARVDALLASGRRAGALAVLHTLDLATLPRRVELMVTRGELAAAADDWVSARADFDAALSERLPAGLEERALFGRASCARAVGDLQGARRDLDRLLATFPAGRLAAAAQAAR
jgi:hypothetical protein